MKLSQIKHLPAAAAVRSALGRLIMEINCDLNSFKPSQVTFSIYKPLQNKNKNSKITAAQFCSRYSRCGQNEKFKRYDKPTDINSYLWIELRFTQMINPLSGKNIAGRCVFYLVKRTWYNPGIGVLRSSAINTDSATSPDNHGGVQSAMQCNAVQCGENKERC